MIIVNWNQLIPNLTNILSYDFAYILSGPTYAPSLVNQWRGKDNYNTIFVSIYTTKYPFIQPRMAMHWNWFLWFWLYIIAIQLTIVIGLALMQIKFKYTWNKKYQIYTVSIFQIHIYMISWLHETRNIKYIKYYYINITCSWVMIVKSRESPYIKLIQKQGNTTSPC